MRVSTPRHQAGILHLASSQATNRNQVSASRDAEWTNQDEQSYSIPCRHTALSRGFDQGAIRVTARIGTGPESAALILAPVRRTKYRNRCHNSHSVQAERSSP
ncbi:hypothetical protein V8C26DRAFT_386839 [Trichoderma gracile]